MIEWSLSNEIMRKCAEFSVMCAGTQQEIEFGSYQTTKRPKMEIARDIFIGKLAEVAISEFLLQTYNIPTNLDFNVYPRGEWDDSDFTIFDKRIDVKASKANAKWLLVELNKLEFRKKENKLPDYFVFALIDWSKEKNQPTGLVKVAGYAKLEDICIPSNIGIRSYKICDEIENTLYLARDTHLPRTGTVLQADNCARRLEDLNTDFYTFAMELRTCRKVVNSML